MNNKLRKNEKKALFELKKEILKKFPVVKFIIFGSKTKGNFNKDSDIDVLIIIKRKVTGKIMTEIFDIAYEIELKYNVIFGIIIEDVKFWNSPFNMVLPLFREINKYGLVL